MDLRLFTLAILRNLDIENISRSLRNNRNKILLLLHFQSCKLHNYEIVMFQTAMFVIVMYVPLIPFS